MVKTIAYTYESDIHCPDCTSKRFMWNSTCKGKPDENSVDDEAVDNEGNSIRPVFDTDEKLHGDILCGACLEVIDRDTTANSNLLFNLKCPDCGNDERLRIVARVCCDVTDDGNHEWDESSFCFCPECNRDGPLSDFHILKKDHSAYTKITVHNVDVELLRQQRNYALGMVGVTAEGRDFRDGIVNLLEAMLDSAEGFKHGK